MGIAFRRKRNGDLQEATSTTKSDVKLAVLPFIN